MVEIEEITNLIGSLPLELSSYILNRVIQNIFTKTEIIRFLVLHEDYSKYISLNDLTVIITEDGSLKFEREPLSLDCLSYNELLCGEMKILEKLFIDHKISIKDLIIQSNFYGLDFLIKYAQNIQCESISSLSMTLHHYVDLKKIDRLSMTFYKKKFDQFHTIINNMITFNQIKYQLQFVISDGQDFKEVVKILQICHKLKNIKISFKILFYFDITLHDSEDFYFIYKIIKYFPSCRMILNEYENYIDDLKVAVKINLSNPDVYNDDRLYCFFKHLGPDLIDKLIIDSTNDSTYRFNFDIIGTLCNLKFLEVKCDQIVDINTFGDLSNLKHLKKIIFQCDSISFDWLSSNLPKNIETLQLFQNFSNDGINTDNSTFIIPKNLKNLVIESDDPKASIDFKRFRFDDSINLRRIIILDYFLKNFNVEIINMNRIPNSLKELRFHDNNNFMSSLTYAYLTFDSNIDEKDMCGVYSNIDLRFNSKRCGKRHCRYLNYNFQIFNLKMKRIKNFKKC